MDTSHSSVSSHHYAALLQTVSELRADLEKTTQKIRQLQSDNDDLHAKYGASREELTDMKKKFNEARESYMSAVTEKFEAEQHHDALIDRLKSQLNEKTREFERIRDDLIPHDIDQLRIKVQEELEIRHKQELKAMEAELDLQREKNFAVRRDLERTKAEYSSLVQNQQGEINSLRSEKEELVEVVRVEATKNRHVDYTSSKDEKIRTQASKLAELSHLVELLREELKIARHEKDETTASLEATRAKLDSAQTVLRGKIASIEADNQGLKQKVSLLETEVDRKDSSILSSKAAAEDYANRIDELLRDAESSARGFNMAKADLNRQIEAIQATADKEHLELSQEVDSLRATVMDREEALHRVQREASDMQLRAEGMERELRRSHLTLVQDLRRKLTSNELELADSTQALRSLQDQLLTVQEQTSFEKDALASEVSRLKREKDILHSKLRDAENNAEVQRKKQLSSQQEFTTKLTNAERRLRDNGLSAAQAEGRISSLTNKVAELERDRQQARDNYDQLERRYNQMLMQVDTLKSDFQKQLQSVGPSVKDRMDSLQRQMKTALAKERKRAEGYKAKALEAHYRMKALGEVGPAV